jgi:CRP/FNR family transcriptional regulator
MLLDDAREGVRTVVPGSSPAEPVTGVTVVTPAATRRSFGMTEHEIPALLRGVQLFAGLDADSLRRLAARCVMRAAPAGTLLFRTGELCRGLYIVAEGRVRIYRVSSDGREQVLHVQGAGEAVAELPLLDEGPYPASAVTVEDSRLVFLPRAEFEQLYRSSPDAAHAIITALGKRLRHLVHVTQTLAFRDVAARLALLLVGYADRAGRPTAEGVEVPLDRTQEELAMEIGAARESVSRALKQLQRKGLLGTVERDHVVIPDVDRLRTIAAPGERPRL